jgi:hypothetical protein
MLCPIASSSPCEFVLVGGEFEVAAMTMHRQLRSSKLRLVDRRCLPESMFRQRAACSDLW